MLYRSEVVNLVHKKFCDLLGCYELYKNEFAKKINELEREKQYYIDRAKMLDEKLREFAKTNTVCINELDMLRKELADAKAKIDELMQQINNYSEKPYSGKHTLAKITYRRPMFVAKNDVRDFQIDVRQFIMPNNFEIYDDISSNNLFYTQNKNLDELIPKIYYLAKKNYSYEYDSQFGFSELWMFPFETLQMRKLGKGADCDDWAILIGSYFACAGIPRDRWWVSAGYTRSGEGHATVYAKDNSGNWHHLNSTNPYPRNAQTLAEFPLKDDEKDSIGIEPDSFWFSFNDYWSISDFETKSASVSFNKSLLAKRISIKRW